MTDIKERPILFSAPMVRAILEGRKTVTRRPVKGGQIPTEDTSVPAGERQRWSAIGQRDPRYGFCVFGATDAECAKELEEFAPCPYGRRGERLWVRETWYCDHDEVQRGPYLQPADMTDLDEARANGDLLYAADGLTPYEQEQPTWKPSIHMPRWASRILLELTDVRVERLQDISREGCIAEGSDLPVADHLDRAWHVQFQRLWESTGGDWDANPWVWVVEFKQVTP